MILKQGVRVIFGLLITAFGANLTIFANIGVAPWDTLGLGIAVRTPLSYGVAMTIISAPS